MTSDIQKIVDKSKKPPAQNRLKENQKDLERAPKKKRDLSDFERRKRLIKASLKQ